MKGERKAIIDPGPTSQTVGVIDILRKNGVDSLDEIPKNYEKMEIKEEPGVTVYISPLRD